jgi:hypothetical protein
MLSGKQFNRAVQGLTLTYEAVMSLWLASFFDWCGTTERLTDIPDLFWDALLRCIERTELKCIDHIPFLSALIFWSIILAASRNMSQSLNVGETAHPHSRKSFIRGARCASGVYAACTVEQMLSGKQFNRAVQGLTLTYDAVMSLWRASYFDWCGTTERLKTTIAPKFANRCDKA